MPTIITSIQNSYPIFIDATLLTLQLTAAAVAIGTVIGLFFALLKISPKQFLNKIANFYITLIRGTPLIVQLFFVYYGVYTFVDFGAFWSASIALAVHNGAYIAEIFRGGIQSIGKGQTEAARSLGMNYAQAMRRIVLPQAFRRVVPPLGNQFIIALKDSSLAAFIAIPELFGVSMRLASSTFRTLEFYSIVAIYYLALVVVFSFLVHKLEMHLAVGQE